VFGKYLGEGTSQRGEQKCSPLNFIALIEGNGLSDDLAAAGRTIGVNAPLPVTSVEKHSIFGFNGF
jgi:hypothetical protein